MTRDLETLGVQVWTNSPVSELNNESILVGKELISSATVLWAAGTQASELGKSMSVELDGQGRVKVRNDLSLKAIQMYLWREIMASLSEKMARPFPRLHPLPCNRENLSLRRSCESSILSLEKASSIWIRDKWQPLVERKRLLKLEVLNSVDFLHGWRGYSYTYST